jgi:hypothetical protein
VKKDDASLPADAERRVRKYADLLLRKASAYGRFPTPVEDLISAAKLEIARESALAKLGLDRFYRRLPNAFKLAPDTIKRAAEKVLGLLDRRDRTIHLDPDAHPKRKLYVSIHEVGHDFLPHQRQTFQIIEDSEAEIDQDTHDLFEREANCFASDVLFQIDAFTREAADFALGIKVPINLAKKYGPSVYSAVRRYVATHRHPCALVVYNQPIHIVGTGEVIQLRRAVASPTFKARFGNRAWPETCGENTFFFENRPKNKFTAPRPIRLKDVNGDTHACIAEAFNSTHQILFLIYPTEKPALVLAG